MATKLTNQWRGGSCESFGAVLVHPVFRIWCANNHGVIFPFLQACHIESWCRLVKLHHILTTSLNHQRILSQGTPVKSRSADNNEGGWCCVQSMTVDRSISWTCSMKIARNSWQFFLRNCPLLRISRQTPNPTKLLGSHGKAQTIVFLSNKHDLLW